MAGRVWCSNERREEERREETSEWNARRKEEWKGDEGEVREGMLAAEKQKERTGRQAGRYKCMHVCVYAGGWVM